MVVGFIGVLGLTFWMGVSLANGGLPALLVTFGSWLIDLGVPIVAAVYLMVGLWAGAMIAVFFGSWIGIGWLWSRSVSRTR